MRWVDLNTNRLLDPNLMLKVRYDNDHDCIMRNEQDCIIWVCDLNIKRLLDLNQIPQVYVHADNDNNDRITWDEVIWIYKETIGSESNAKSKKW